MHSVLRKKSYGSVKVFWLDQKKVLELAEHAGRELLASHPEAIRVGVFGSIARQRAVPGSDLDVFVILQSSDVRPMHRAAAYQKYFDEINIGVDLFCLTDEETAKSTFYQRNVSETLWFER